MRELDFGDMTFGGVLEALRDPAFFARVVVDPVTRTVSWPNGVDLDPDVLHGDHEPANGRAARVLAQYQLRSTG